MALCAVDSFLRAHRSAAAVLSWLCHVTWVSLIPAPLFACSVMLLFALILSHFVMRCYGSVNRRFLSAGSPFCCRSVVMILSCYLSFVGFLVCPCARVPVDSSCARVPVDSSCARVPGGPWGDLSRKVEHGGICRIKLTNNAVFKQHLWGPICVWHCML